MALLSEAPFETSRLIFPESAGNFSDTLLALKKSRLSIRNRLTSILTDAKFAQQVASANRLPLVANERCGSWYIPTEKKAGSVYFKSTDGHQSQWKFSTRRLNLELPEIASKHGGCVVVDSTRRGKTMPDALSKTIPIWCAVLNYFMFPLNSESHELVVPDEQVGASEASQIRRRLDEWRMDLAMLGLEYEGYAAKAKKPFRPYFVSPADGFTKLELDPRYTPIICCSVSRREQGDNDTYVQGAGDDNENWSRGLTPSLFWEHRNQLNPQLDETELAARIDAIVDAQEHARRPSKVHRVDVGLGVDPLYICDLDTLEALPAMKAEMGEAHRPYDLLVTCDVADEDDKKNTKTAAAKELPSFRHLARHTIHLRCSSGKLGSKNLRRELSRMASTMLNVAGVESRGSKLLFACGSGIDLAVGTALAASLVLYSHARDSRGVAAPAVDKPFVRSRLAVMSSQYPQASPSRATLQSVNAFLMQDNSALSDK